MGMIAYRMAIQQYLLVDVRVLHHVFADTEEGTFRLVLLQLFKDEWRGFGMGAVVESQVNGRDGRREIPVQLL